MTPLALLLVLAGAASPSPHQVEVGASFVYGMGSQQAFGWQVEGTYGYRLWESASATGTLEAGLLLGHQAEPHSLYASYIGGVELGGANHRLQGWLVLGHGLQLPPARRMLLSVQVFGGWTQLLVRGSLKNEALGVSGEASADAGVFATGLVARWGVRVTEDVSVNLRVMAPFPYALEVNSWFLGTLGVSLRLP